MDRDGNDRDPNNVDRQTTNADGRRQTGFLKRAAAATTDGNGPSTQVAWHPRSHKERPSNISSGIVGHATIVYFTCPPCDPAGLPKSLINMSCAKLQEHARAALHPARAPRGRPGRCSRTCRGPVAAAAAAAAGTSAAGSTASPPRRSS